MTSGKSADPYEPDLPRDLEAELAVLHCALFRPQEAAAFLREVSPGEFFFERTQRACEALLELIRKKHSISPAALENEVRCGGAKDPKALIEEITKNKGAQSPSAVELAVSRIRGAALQRNRLSRAQELLNVAKNNGDFTEALKEIIEIEKKRAPEQSPLNPWNLREALENPPQDNNPWLFDGVIARTGGGILNLDSGEGKTWIQLEIGMCVTTGRSLFGKFKCSTCGPALILFEEDAPENILDRARQLVRAKNLDDGEYELLTNLHILNYTGLQLDTEQGISALRRLTEKLMPAFIGIDPMAEVHTQPENDAQKMLSFLKPLRALARECGAFVFLSHHTRKAYSTQDPDTKQTGRGTSALKAWADSAWYLKKVGETSFTVATKQRQGAAAAPAVTTFSLKRIEDRESATQSWQVSEGIEAEIQTNQHAIRILELLQDAPQGRLFLKQIEKAAPRMSGGRRGKAIAFLEEAGKVVTGYEEAPGKDSKMRQQKFIQLSDQPAKTAEMEPEVDQWGATEESTTTKDTTRDKTGLMNQGTEDNPIGFSVNEGSNSVDQRGQPRTNTRAARRRREADNPPPGKPSGLASLEGQRGESGKAWTAPELKKLPGPAAVARLLSVLPNGLTGGGLRDRLSIEFELNRTQALAAIRIAEEFGAISADGSHLYQSRGNGMDQ